MRWLQLAPSSRKMYRRMPWSRASPLGSSDGCANAVGPWTPRCSVHTARSEPRLRSDSDPSSTGVLTVSDERTAHNTGEDRHKAVAFLGGEGSPLGHHRPGGGMR